MRRRIFVWLGTVCLVCGLLLTGCRDDGSGKGFRFPLTGEPSQLDPQAAADQPSVVLSSVLFEGLTRREEDGSVVPAAADWTVSPDGLTYTFRLRESCWSTLSIRGETTPWDEPTPVTADDFVFGLQRVVSPETRSPYAAELDGIVNAEAVRTGKKKPAALGVTATDDRTLTVRLTAPDPDFPAKAASTAYLPCNRTFFEYTRGRYGLEKQTVLTNGPFVLAAWNHGDSLLLHKNEGYHAAAEIRPTAVRFVIGTEDETAALLSGTLDAGVLTPDRRENAIRAGVTTVTLRDSIRAVWFNTGNTLLKNASMRRALRDAVAWKTVYAYLETAGEPTATGFVAPDALCGTAAYRETAKALTFRTDAAAARKSLATAVKETTPTGMTAQTPQFAVLAADDEVSANLARYLVQSWQKNLGIGLTLELVPEARVNARLQSGNYQIAVAVTTADGLTAARNLQYTFGKNSAGNYSLYTGSSVETALNAAQAAVSDPVALQKAEAALYKASPQLPLSFPVRTYGIAAGDTGVTVRPFGGGELGCPFGFRGALKFEE